MLRWEYMFVMKIRQDWWGNGQKIGDSSTTTVFALFNDLGVQGWELVTYYPEGFSVLKRPRAA